MRGGSGRSNVSFLASPPSIGLNQPVLTYYLADDVDQLHVDVLDASGEIVRTLGERGGLPVTAGIHQVSWNLRRRGPRSLGSGRPTPGAVVAPARYQLRLTATTAGGVPVESSAPLEVQIDPRVSEAGITVADLEAQVELANQISEAINTLRDRVLTIRGQREQVDSLLERPALGETLLADARAVQEEMTAIEGLLLQTEEGKVGAELEPQLQSQMTYLYGMVSSADQRPGQDAYDRFRDVKAELDELLERLTTLQTGALANLNRALADAAVPAIAPATSRGETGGRD